MNTLTHTLKSVQDKAKFNHVVTQLLSDGTTNTKTNKNTLRTFIMYIAPHKYNDKNKNLCGFASSGCIASCLYSAGRGKFTSVQEARIRKANYFVNAKLDFIHHLAIELITKNKTAQKQGKILAIRLNGTSDLDFVYMLERFAGLDIKTLENILFYDYTKSLKRAIRYISHPNYIVTFSKSETNEQECIQALKLGINVAVVFNELPKTWNGAIVIDGDKSDIEMLYNEGKVLGLIAKGDAKKDTSGFVVK